ncbi:Ribosomal protein S6e [mine drainage metagenome]|uniref:Ribosomal protein S6e n=1 Tax=mine drainage metagenome TaxID=410659 RepID=T1AZX5_9ZZZZ
MKLIYSDPKTGLSASMELDEDKKSALLNRKIGDEIDASVFGLTGYKVKITGGSDSSGFPLDRSMQGQLKRKTLRERKKKSTGERVYKRVTVRGNMISTDTNQVSVAIMEYGSKPIEEIFPKKESPPDNKDKEAK